MALTAKALIIRTIEFLRKRRGAYNLIFKTDPGQIVLRDLAKYCRANRTTAHPNHDVSLILQGRREVWLRIQEHLELSSSQLFKLYNPSFQQNVEIEGDDDV